LQRKRHGETISLSVVSICRLPIIDSRTPPTQREFGDPNTDSLEYKKQQRWGQYRFDNAAFAFIAASNALSSDKTDPQFSVR